MVVEVVRWFFFSRSDIDTTAWLTEGQIIEDMKNADDVRACIEAEEWEVRDHEIATLAAQGKKQYKYTKSVHTDAAAVADKAQVSATTELKEEEYEATKKHMQDSMGKGVDKKRKHIEPKTESPDKKRRRDALQSRTTRLRKVKQLLDTCHNDLVKTRDDLSKLTTKGYPEQMVQWCEAKIVSFEEREWVPVQSEYNKAIVVFGLDQASIEEVEKSGNMFDGLLQKLSAAWTSWKKTSGEEVRKLCC